MRKPDPQRIHDAKRAGRVARLGHEHGTERAEALMAAWEASVEAAALDPAAHAWWDAAETWIAARAAAKGS